MMSEWISVEDRLPGEGEDVIGWHGNHKEPYAWIVSRERYHSAKSYEGPGDLVDWVEGDWEIVPDEVTHWMPLPDGPDAAAGSIGSQLRALRKERGLTLAAVSAATGVSVSFLSEIERGVTDPSLATLSALAAHYGRAVHITLEPQP